ncbi:MAG: preprotein translocase subunit SecE [Methylococcaceae bacterium]
MNTQAEASAPVADIVKQVFSAVFVVAAIAAFYYFSDIQLLYRVLALIITVALSAWMLSTTNIGRVVWQFSLDSKQEIRKVVWPTREETTRTTLLVFAMVFIVGLILWLLDTFLFWGVRLLTGQGG